MKSLICTELEVKLVPPTYRTRC